ncbi:MAG: TfoX/Sxy family protein [Aristaeellaceae bacterium]
MGELSLLPNIGPEVERQLNAAGVTTAAELRALGAEEAWLRIQANDPSACLHRLLALEGAIQGVKKTLLSPARKAELKAFCQARRKG